MKILVWPGHQVLIQSSLLEGASLCFLTQHFTGQPWIFNPKTDGGHSVNRPQGGLHRKSGSEVLEMRVGENTENFYCSLFNVPAVKLRAEYTQHPIIHRFQKTTDTTLIRSVTGSPALNPYLFSGPFWLTGPETPKWKWCFIKSGLKAATDTISSSGKSFLSSEPEAVSPIL